MCQQTFQETQNLVCHILVDTNLLSATQGKKKMKWNKVINPNISIKIKSLYF